MLSYGGCKLMCRWFIDNDSQHDVGVNNKLCIIYFRAPWGSNCITLVPQDYSCIIVACRSSTMHCTFSIISWGSVNHQMAINSCSWQGECWQSIVRGLSAEIQPSWMFGPSKSSIAVVSGMKLFCHHILMFPGNCVLSNTLLCCGSPPWSFSWTIIFLPLINLCHHCRLHSTQVL